MFVEPLEERWLLSVASQSLLFAGIDDSAASPTNAGLIMAADVGTGIVAPLHATLPVTSGVATLSTGISGLAFDATGKLWGSTEGGAGTTSTSNLVRIDPITGTQLSSVSIADGSLRDVREIADRLRPWVSAARELTRGPTAAQA